MESDTDLITAYQIDMRRRGLQPGTVDRITTSLRLFVRETGTRNLLTVEPDDIEMFLDARPRLSAKTRYGYLSCLHNFYQFVIRVGYGTEDPTLIIPRPKLHRGLPRPASNADLEMALAMAPPRIRAMLSLAAYGGLRCIEIARLSRDDVLDHEDPPTVIAHGKGSKDRIVPLHEDAWSALRMYGLPRAGALFRQKSGRPVQPWNVSEECNAYLAGLGIDARMHRLRHWFATNLYRTSGHDLLMVADLMGHSSTATTMIYAGYDRAGAPEAVQALTARPLAAAE